MDDRAAQVDAERRQSDVAMAELRSQLAATTAELAAARDALATTQKELDSVRDHPAWQSAHDEQPHRPDADHHLILLPTANGYQLLVRQGAAPSAGAAIELPGDDGNHRYLVVKTTRAPLPASDLRCAYVETESSG
jgi:hypothetical protein